jgi:anti-sigma regulatory factor (Ser/Thr protein kinase)
MAADSTTKAITQRAEHASHGCPTSGEIHRMSGDAAMLRDARRMVAGALGKAATDLRNTAVLLTGELVTNALVHGGGWFLLEVAVSDAGVRVEVTDGNGTRPRVLRPSGEREHGRGMAIVDAMAGRWGTDERGTHKVVWFELDAAA